MHHRYKVYIRRFLLAGLSSLLLAPALFYGWLCILRPSRSDRQQVLFQGIVYQRRAVSQMRPVMLHIVTIDLSAPGVKPLVTPGLPEKVKKLTPELPQNF